MRPISMCNISYKILSKILCNRFTDILPLIIDENQGGFVKGHGTKVNTIIVLELLDFMLKQNPSLGHEAKHVVLKLEIQNAYDRVR